MTLTRFVTKSAFRNRRRSILTVLSITFSLLLLTMMMTVWRSFYIDQGTAQEAQRLVTRHRVSLTEWMPAFYREKIRAIPGVVAVAPNNWFGGLYIDDKPEHFFAQFGTDPDEIFKIFTDVRMPADQLAAWQRDRAGCVVDDQLAKKFGWKLGDRIHVNGTIYPVNLELTIRGIFHAPLPTSAIYFNQKYVEEAVAFAKGQAGMFDILVDTPGNVAHVATTVDDMFHNSPQPTKTESEKAFQLSFINSMGNVKAFILSICGAVVFAILLVSGNTMAMSIRARTREVAVLKTLGFTRQRVLSMFVGEAITLSVAGGALGVLGATLLIRWLTHSPLAIGIPAEMKVTIPTMLACLLVAATVGFISGCLPAYNASRTNIVEGLRHIG